MAAKPQQQSQIDAITGTQNRGAQGVRIAAFRKQADLTLAEVAEVCALSEATLSRIENGQTRVSADTLFVMARLFAVDMADFFGDTAAPLTKGMRSITRSGEVDCTPMARYSSEVLNADLSRKQMLPAINHVAARTLDDVGGLQAHVGEEFVYVLGGAIMLHSELYAPTRLNEGDSCYFDAAMAHAYLNAGASDTATILVVVRAEDR